MNRLSRSGQVCRCGLGSAIAPHVFVLFSDAVPSRAGPTSCSPRVLHTLSYAVPASVRCVALSRARRSTALQVAPRQLRATAESPRAPSLLTHVIAYSGATCVGRQTVWRRMACNLSIQHLPHPTPYRPATMAARRHLPDTTCIATDISVVDLSNFFFTTLTECGKLRL